MSISNLYFRGRSTADFSGVTVAACDYGDTELKRSEEDIAGRDGSIISHPNGRRFKQRQITLVLNVQATPTTLESRLSELRDWLSGGVGKLTDDYNTGRVLTGADFVSAHTDYIDMFRGCAQLTVKMTADPRWAKSGEINRRIIKFAASGAAALTITDNSSYTLTRGGTTTTGTYTAAEPYTYRLTAYAEGAHTITLSGAEIQPEEPFTMPSNAEIAISGNGYGYYELWHDTREVRV